ncbi:MAG: Bax inhibitor-1/YccA family protein [Deltaproteobacteria bacterium]|nr:Bax inhibitor-1/YccA family protein [Deltaproteobacteria bacterium]
MADLHTFQTVGTRASQETKAAEVAAFMGSVYRWMAFGLAVTGFTAFYVANSETAVNAIFGNPMVFYGLLFAQLGLVFAFTPLAMRVSSAIAGLIFIAYSGLTGVTLSAIFLRYTQSSIAQTFLITAGAFAALSFYGATTKRDLNAMGRFMMVGLFGLIIASVVNIFMQSPAIYWVSTYAGVLIFSGLTAYENQRLRELYRTSGQTGNLALRGALMFYLDFINLFLMLLRLFGSERR